MFLCCLQMPEWRKPAERDKGRLKAYFSALIEE
jgi:hypothetical protein